MPMRRALAMSDLIFAYTRQQALQDGVLVDCSEHAKELGFKIPVALTAETWARCVTVPDQCDWQDEPGRLHDVLWMLFVAIRKQPQTSDVLHYIVLVQNDQRGPKPIELKAVCGPDDSGDACLTLMLPDQD